MSRVSWQEVVAAAAGDGSAVGNTTTPTSLLAAADRQLLLGGQPNWWVGKQWRIIAAGRISNIVTTPGTLTLEFRLGPTSAIAAFSSGGMQLSTTAHTNVPWWFEGLFTVRAVGASTSANLMGQGRFTSQAASLTAVADSATTPATLLAPNTAPAVGTGFDSTVTNQADLYATWSIANAGNTIQCHQFSLQALN